MRRPNVRRSSQFSLGMLLDQGSLMLVEALTAGLSLLVRSVVPNRGAAAYKGAVARCHLFLHFIEVLAYFFN